MDHYRTRPASLVTLEGIAADAGVGIATLYRHFPSRASLRQACALGFIERFEEFLQATITDFDADPEAMWARFVLTLADYGVGMLAGALAEELPNAVDGQVRAQHDRFFADLEMLLGKAAVNKLVSPAQTPMEFAAELVVATRPMDDHYTALFPDVRERLVRHLLTAWRTEAAA